MIINVWIKKKKAFKKLGVKYILKHKMITQSQKYQYLNKLRILSQIVLWPN